MRIQAIMTRAYEKYGDNMSYMDFLASLTELERKAVVIGNLNYQVENGGFMQWDDNGYSKGKVFLFDTLQAIGTETSKKVLELTERALTKLAQNRNVNAQDDKFYEMQEQFLTDAEAYFVGQEKDQPMTCMEAAKLFRAAASKAVFEGEAIRLEAMADLMETFGDVPVPTKVIAEYTALQPKKVS